MPARSKEDAAKEAGGFGIISKSQPPRFNIRIREQAEEAVAFFKKYNYAVLEEALSAEEVAGLNEWIDSTQRHRRVWVDNQYCMPLLDHPELDGFIQHPGSFPAISSVLGGDPRYAEFNFRQADADVAVMKFHHDIALEDRKRRREGEPIDFCNHITYLTDVSEETAAFCVVPGSSRFEDVREARKKLGGGYCEQPIYGPAGTSVICDAAILHTRLRGSGDSTRRRRTLHQYYARGGQVGSRKPPPNLTDWNLIPERLVRHEDPGKQRFFSQWNGRQREWVAHGFSLKMRARLPRAVGIPGWEARSPIGTGYIGGDGHRGDPGQGKGRKRQEPEEPAQDGRPVARPQLERPCGDAAPRAGGAAPASGSAIHRRPGGNGKTGLRNQPNPSRSPEYMTGANVSNQEEVQVLEEQGDWSRVRTSSGSEGWLQKKYLRR